jgi:protein AaeX
LKFVEVNLLGVYVAPISVLLIVAWIVTVGLRRVADRFGLLRHVWHPALFVFDIYIIVLSSMILVIAR